MTEPTVFGDFALFSPGVIEIILGHLKRKEVVRFMLTTSKSFGSTLSSKINWFNLVRMHFSRFYRRLEQHLVENLSGEEFAKELEDDRYHARDDDFWLVVRQCNLNSHTGNLEYANGVDRTGGYIQVNRPGGNRRWDKAYYGLAFDKYSMPEDGCCDNPQQIAEKFPHFIGEIIFKQIDFGDDYEDSGDCNMKAKHLGEYYGEEISNFDDARYVRDLCVSNHPRHVDPTELYTFYRSNILSRPKYSQPQSYESKVIWQFYLGTASKSVKRYHPHFNFFLV